MSRGIKPEHRAFIMARLGVPPHGEKGVILTAPEAYKKVYGCADGTAEHAGYRLEAELQSKGIFKEMLRRAGLDEVFVIQRLRELMLAEDEGEEDVTVKTLADGGTEQTVRTTRPKRVWSARSKGVELWVKLFGYEAVRSVMENPYASLELRIIENQLPEEEESQEDSE